MNSRTTLSALTLTASLLIAGCSQPSTRQVDTTTYVERSKAVANELKTSLGGQLKQALEAGGPQMAISVCTNIAQPLTERLSSENEELHISRTSLRTRNPANQADTQSASVMQTWQAILSADEPLPEYHIQQTDEAIIVHLPIMMDEVCLKCHGDESQFPPALSEQIAALYPGDQATGFALGELRGAIRIEFSQ